MKNDPKSKKGKILKHLQDGKVLTHLIAIRLYSHSRLAVAINRLRDEGYDITTTMKKSMFNEPYGEYTLKS